MKKLLLAAFVFLPALVFAQASPGEMTAAEKYARPGESHLKLAEYDGEWVETISIWSAPKSTAEIFYVTCTNSMILGDRFLLSTHIGYLGKTGYERYTILGQHTTNQKFTLTQMDNQGTGTLTLLGFWTTPMKTMELFGDIPNASNTDVAHVRQVIEFIDENNYVIKNYDKRAGHDEYLSAKYRFKRKD